MLRAYKYRILPSEKQKEQIEQHFGCCRLVWNLALEAKQRAYAANKTTVSRYDLQKQLLELKQEYRWLYEVNAQSLQSVLLHLDTAYKNFFKGGGFVRFKGRKGRQSFQCPQGVKLIGDEIQLPIIGKVNIIVSRIFEGKIKTVTISRTPTGKYYASILVDNGVALPVKPQVTPEKTVGLDVGLKSFVITSDGRSFAPNRHLKQNLERLKILQRRASKKKNGSQNRKKANLCVAKLHEKITNQRVDYIQKITSQLIGDSQADTFVVEDLGVVNMLKNHKLAQSISDVSWGKFFEVLQYKCDWYGKNLIKIGRFEPSSKRCSNCGHVKESLSLSEREWTCSECNTTHDRDINAAQNIKYYGLQKTIVKNKTPEGIREEPVERRRLRRAMKQENIFV